MCCVSWEELFRLIGALSKHKQQEILVNVGSGHLLTAEDHLLTFEDLGKKAKMGSSLLSYHLHGTYKTEGLEQLGLITLKKHREQLTIQLTTLGKLLIKGYI